MIYELNFNTKDEASLLTTHFIETYILIFIVNGNIAAEADRIRECNGRVVALKQEPHIQRVWLPHEDTPGLAMSRAFGDFLLKDHGIISTPDISFRRLTPNDQFIVLATDGVRRPCLALF